MAEAMTSSHKFHAAGSNDVTVNGNIFLYLYILDQLAFRNTHINHSEASVAVPGSEPNVLG